jgi:GST-like protein
LTLSESAAILVYLAEKTRKLLPAAGQARARVMEQMFLSTRELARANQANSTGRATILNSQFKY